MTAILALLEHRPNEDNMVGRIIIGCLLLSLSAAAQEPVSAEAVPTQQSTSTFKGKLLKLQQFLDNKARKRVDPHYIEVPDKPWRVILRFKVNQVGVDYSNSMEVAGFGQTDWSMSVRPPLASSIGFWVGYRGTGLSYSQSLTKNAGRYFSISSTGAKYGFNFRLRRFKTEDISLTGKVYQDGELVEDMKDEPVQTFAPFWVRSVYLNGYYVFNGRRYSQAAAYNQSVIQRRSAGSFLLGATWYQSSLDYSDPHNAGMILLSHNIGRIKLHQANIGFGYGYNLVPFPGLVVNAMVMPTISVYNRVKVYRYDTNYDLSSAEGVVDDFGAWDSKSHTWANGKTHKPLELTDDEGLWTESADAWEMSSETNHGYLRFTVDARLGIAYNWSNYFIGVQAQFSHFSYKFDKSQVSLNDGYARLSMGMRF